MKKKYLTVKDMTSLFKLSSATVYRKIKAGYFPSVKSGRRILIPEDLLEDFIQKRREEAVEYIKLERGKAYIRNKALVDFWEKIEEK